MKELKESDYFRAWLLFFLIGTRGGRATTINGIAARMCLPLLRLGRDKDPA